MNKKILNYFLKGLIIISILSPNAHAMISDFNIKPSSLKSTKFMDINILDAKQLKFKNIDEISALAYEKNTLYALNDKSILYTFEISILNNKIETLTLKDEIKLKSKKQKKLKKKNKDSEGLVLIDGGFLVSFEKNSRVELYDKKAKMIEKKELHRELQNLKNYKEKNKGLEALAYNKKYKLITAPEVPLKKKDKNYHTLYSKNETWKFMACGDIKALEFINKNELMILQTEHSKKTKNSLVTISKLNLKNGAYKILAKLDSKNGWKIDNFEGLTKVGKNKFLIISDNQSDSSQKTLLVLFEIN